MVTDLDLASITDYLEEPGVALLAWRSPRDPHTLSLDRTLEALSRTLPEVRFARVDVTSERRLALLWAVDETPTWTVYRDGVLVFRRAGTLAPLALEGLLEVIVRLSPDCEPRPRSPLSPLRTESAG